MAEPREMFAARCRAAIAAFGENVASLVESDEGFSLRLQARWIKSISEAMHEGGFEAGDKLNEERLEKLLIVAIIDSLINPEDGSEE